MQKLPVTVICCLLMLQTFAQSAAKPLRVGIAGVTHDHVHGILGRPKKGDIVISGIAEPNRAIAIGYCKRYGFDTSLVYSSLEEMVEKTKPEAVFAFNAIFEHLKVVEYCAPKGIHVMVEKPLAVSVEHANKMAALARKHKIHLLTNYETTWYPSLAKAYQMGVTENKLGDLRRFVFHTGHPGPKEIGCSPQFLAWLTDPVMNGAGALTDFGCYGANTSTWMLKGEVPESVSAITQQIKPSIYPKVDDDATIVIKYKSTQVIIQASWNWPFGRKDMELYGKTGFLFCKDGKNMSWRETERQPTIELTAEPLTPPHDDAFALFASVVRGDARLPAFDPNTLENNEIVVRILEAAKIAATTGKTVVWKDHYK